MLDQKFENLTTEQLVFINMLSIEAIVDVLIKKGVCTKEDILETLNEVKKRQDEYVRNLIKQSEENKEGE